MLLWLASYPHGTRRFRKAGGIDVFRQRASLKLQSLPWLLQRLQQVGLADTWEEGNASRRNSTVIQGVVEVVVGPVWRSVLTLVSAEADVLHQYFLKASDAYVLSAVRYARLASPVVVHAAAPFGAPYGSTVLRVTLLGRGLSMGFISA